MAQEIPLYQVDAFAGEVFRGNPAAVCPLDDWLPDALLQAIAAENNLSETAYFIPRNGEFALRWFTPKAEVDLCGHATLASAYVIANYLEPGRQRIRFESRSGPLEVRRDDETFTLDFPVIEMAPREPDEEVAAALGTAPLELWEGMDLMAVLESEAALRALAPDQARLAELETRGMIVTAPGEAVDFVSRFFAPRHGIPEDPVTGSAHCALAPYWAQRLGKTEMSARQISARGGELAVELKGARVLIGGRVAPYLVGTIRI